MVTVTGGADGPGADGINEAGNVVGPVMGPTGAVGSDATTGCGVAIGVAEILGSPVGAEFDGAGINGATYRGATERGEAVGFGTVADGVCPGGMVSGSCRMRSSDRARLGDPNKTHSPSRKITITGTIRYQVFNLNFDLVCFLDGGFMHIILQDQARSDRGNSLVRNDLLDCLVNENLISIQFL